MKLKNYQWAGMVLCGLILISCEPDGEALMPETPEMLTPKVSHEDLLNKQESTVDYFRVMLQAYESTVLSTYTVQFLERISNETNGNITTTFKYKVTGGGETPQLDSFFMETPECAGSVVSYFPRESAFVSSNGIKWNSSLSKDGSQEYSITYRGDIPLGIVNATATRGSNTETNKIIGPCKGVYTLSGSIYIDANSDGNKQQSESGISSVLMELYNTKGFKFGAVSTGPNGSYSFKVLQGDYRINVTNDLLGNDHYKAVGSSSTEILGVTENLAGFNFGFRANTTKLIEDLETKIILDTEPTKYWIQQIRNAGKSNSDYSVEEITTFLTGIEQMLLPEPFQFGANKHKNALNILTRPIRTDLDEYLQQLLTAELNVISGRGAKFNSGESNAAFNEALLIYGEAVACRELQTCPAEVTTSWIQTKASSSDTQLFKSFNGSGGI